MKTKNIVNDAILKDVIDQIHDVAFGTITISVYNSKIVQIDVTTTETKRYEDDWLVEEGSGI